MKKLATPLLFAAQSALGQSLPSPSYNDLNINGSLVFKQCTGYLYSNGSAPVSCVAPNAIAPDMPSLSSANDWLQPQAFGANGSVTGEAKFANGASAGAFVTIRNNAAETAYNFNLPATAGTAGYALVSGGGGSAPNEWAPVGRTNTTNTWAALQTFGAGISVSGAATLAGPTTTIGASVTPSKTPGRFTIVGNTTNGSTTISGISSTSGVQVGYEITGAGIPSCSLPHGAARNQIKSVGANSVTISCAATATTTGVTFNIGRDMYDANSAGFVNSFGAKVGYFGDAATGQNITWANEYFAGFTGNAPQTMSPLIVSGIRGGAGGPILFSRATDAAGSAVFGDHFGQRVFAVADGMTIFGTPSHTWANYDVTIARAAGDGATAQAAVNEFEIVSEWPATDINPYSTSYAHTTTNTSFGCGAGGAGDGLIQPCSAALYVFQNNADPSVKFLEGIVFRNGAISTALDGTLGYAVHMASNQALHWSKSDGVEGGSIWADTNGDLKLRAATGRTVKAEGPFELSQGTVAALPTCDTPRKFSMASVTDANSTTYNAIVAGGGSNVMPVFCDGTNWRVH